MQVIVGWVIVLGCTLGGFVYSGGNPTHLIVIGEYIIIIGVSLGFLFAACPMAYLKLLFSQIMTAFKGSPYNQKAFVDVISAFYELFMIAREQGVIGIEDHVVNPKGSAVFQKYPTFLNNAEAVAFAQDALKPIIDGRIKGDQVKHLLHEEMERIAVRSEHPLHVATKAADAMPGIGIVAAVLGIIITMSHISGDKTTIGVKVAHALVGTFLGIFISYGFIQPLISAIEFNNDDEKHYYEVLSNIITSYATGAPPIMAAESGRRAIPADRQLTGDVLEEQLKALNKKG
ncbi:MAG: motility-associated protein [Verrucomicrobiota bacterium]